MAQTFLTFAKRSRYFETIVYSYADNQIRHFQPRTDRFLHIYGRPSCVWGALWWTQVKYSYRKNTQISVR